jgi:TrmH family RNA methyltransferase
MLSKNELKYIQSLCHKKQREESGLFLAEGPKLVEELLQSDYRIKKILATDQWYQEHQSVPAIEQVTEIDLARISSLQTPNQVLAIVEQKYPEGEPVMHGRLSLVLDGIQDPGNMGTIIRIADWFGVDQVIASEDTVELYNPKVIQSTMGSFMRIKLWYKSLSQFVAVLDVPVYGALLAGNNLYELKAPKEGVLIIGNESKGIRAPLLPFITNPVTIPRIGGAESLNAAVATGILLSHLVT